MTAINVKEKFDQYEYTIKLLTAKVEELAAENARLVAECNAHQTLRLIYVDPNQPAGLRIKAAAASLPHEVPKLMPERAPLELQAEEVIPLADLITQRRARQNQLEGRDIEVSSSAVVRILPKPGSNGNGNDSDH